MKRRLGFTVLELIVVIVVMGILATQINFNPLTDVDKVDNEYGELLQDLKYVKQLNLNQSFFKGDDVNWINESDCFQLVNAKEYQLDNNGNVLIGQNLDNENFVKEINSNITIVDEAGNNVNRICFDNLGRTYKNNLSTANILHEDLTITVSTNSNDYSQTIIIKPITGYIQ